MSIFAETPALYLCLLILWLFCCVWDVSGRQRFWRQIAACWVVAGWWLANETLRSTLRSVLNSNSRILQIITLKWNGVTHIINVIGCTCMFLQGHVKMSFLREANPTWRPRWFWVSLPQPRCGRELSAFRGSGTCKNHLFLLCNPFDVHLHHARGDKTKKSISHHHWTFCDWVTFMGNHDAGCEHLLRELRRQTCFPVLAEFIERCAQGCECLFDNSLASGSFVVLVDPFELRYLCGRLANIWRDGHRKGEN